MDDEYAYADGWWNEPPWSEDINGALHEFQLRDGVLLTLLGGQDGFEKIVRVVFRMQTKTGDTGPDVVYPWGKLPVPRKDGELYTYVDRKFQPLQEWTIDEMRVIVNEADHALQDHDETYKVARILRKATISGQDISVESAGVRRRLPDQSFITIYNIVSQRYGYADVMARLLNLSPQTVMNRVRDLRKKGLIEPLLKKENT